MNAYHAAVFTFLAERLAPEPGGRLYSDDAYAAYGRFAQDRGLPPVTRTLLGRVLTALAGEPLTVRRAGGFDHIRLGWRLRKEARIDR